MFANFQCRYDAKNLIPYQGYANKEKNCKSRHKQASRYRCYKCLPGQHAYNGSCRASRGSPATFRLEIATGSCPCNSPRLFCKSALVFPISTHSENVPESGRYTYPKEIIATLTRRSKSEMPSLALRDS